MQKTSTRDDPSQTALGRVEVAVVGERRRELGGIVLLHLGHGNFTAPRTPGSWGEGSRADVLWAAFGMARLLASLEQPKSRWHLDPPPLLVRVRTTVSIRQDRCDTAAPVLHCNARLSRRRVVLQRELRNKLGTQCLDGQEGIAIAPCTYLMLTSRR